MMVYVEGAIMEEKQIKRSANREAKRGTGLLHWKKGV